MKLIIDADEKIVCKGFEQPLTEEERVTLIRAIGNGKPYNSSDDAISREALLADFKERNIWSKDIVEAINNAPPVEPARLKSEWAEFEGGYRCSNCDDIEVYTPNFCPNCGADMREGVENE